MPTNDEKRRQDLLESRKNRDNKQLHNTYGPFDPEGMPENLYNVQDIEE